MNPSGKSVVASRRSRSLLCVSTGTQRWDASERKAGKLVQRGKRARGERGSKGRSFFRLTKKTLFVFDLVIEEQFPLREETHAVSKKKRARAPSPPLFPLVSKPKNLRIILFYKRQKNKKTLSLSLFLQYGTFFGRLRLMLAASADRSVSLALPLCWAFRAFRSFFAAAGTSASLTPMAR